MVQNNRLHRRLRPGAILTEERTGGVELFDLRLPDALGATCGTAAPQPRPHQAKVELWDATRCFSASSPFLGGDLSLRKFGSNFLDLLLKTR
jgi:hypothetical protein